MMKDSTHHSRSPHDMKLKIEPVRLICPRSTAKTPIWQVTLDATSTRVFAVASGRSRSAIGQCKPWPISTERIVKYIANSAAKNISSLDSQIMVPTLTRFGLLAGLRGTGVVSVTDVVTLAIITTPRRGSPPGPPENGLGGKRGRLSVRCSHEGRCVQSRRRHASGDEARDRPSPRAGRAGCGDHRGRDRARAVP